MTKIEQYALQILANHNVELTTYWGVDGDKLVDELKEAYPDGMEYPYVKVANAIMRISKPTPIKRAPYKMVWDNESCCDSVDFDSLNAAIADAEDTLLLWMMNEREDWKIKTDENGYAIDYDPTEEQKESFDYMVYNCCVHVEEYNPTTDEYELAWEPTYELEQQIGWVPYYE